MKFVYELVIYLITCNNIFNNKIKPLGFKIYFITKTLLHVMEYIPNFIYTIGCNDREQSLL
jgi:hypothetical protein